MKKIVFKSSINFKIYNKLIFKIKNKNINNTLTQKITLT